MNAVIKLGKFTAAIDKIISWNALNTRLIIMTYCTILKAGRTLTFIKIKRWITVFTLQIILTDSAIASAVGY